MPHDLASASCLAGPRVPSAAVPGAELTVPAQADRASLSLSCLLYMGSLERGAPTSAVQGPG